MNMVNNIVRSKYIFVESNKIEILFSNYVTIYSDLLLTILITTKLYAHSNIL